MRILNSSCFGNWYHPEFVVRWRESSAKQYRTRTNIFIFMNQRNHINSTCEVSQNLSTTRQGIPITGRNAKWIWVIPRFLNKRGYQCNHLFQRRNLALFSGNTNNIFSLFLLTSEVQLYSLIMQNDVAETIIDSGYPQILKLPSIWMDFEWTPSVQGIWFYAPGLLFCFPSKSWQQP